MIIDQVPWKKIELVIFDVDGTLYDQRPLRRYMMLMILWHYLWRPHSVYDIFTLLAFRRHREKLSRTEEYDIIKKQYILADEQSVQKTQRVKKIVDHWIRNKPLPLLSRYMYPMTDQLVLTLQESNINVAVLSDYLAKEKLSAMDLSIDHIYSAEDKIINTLKPNPDGIKHILNDLCISPEATVYIGDRDETDGAAARRAGVHSVIVDRTTATHVYAEIINQINVR